MTLSSKQATSSGRKRYYNLHDSFSYIFERKRHLRVETGYPQLQWSSIPKYKNPMHAEEEQRFFFFEVKTMLNENTGAIFSLNLRMDYIFLLDNLQLQKTSNGQ